MSSDKEIPKNLFYEDPEFVRRTIRLMDEDTGEEEEIDIAETVTELIRSFGSEPPSEWPGDIPYTTFIVGLPGSGKSTIARHVTKTLVESGEWFGLHLMLKSFSQVYAGRGNVPVIFFEWERLKRNARKAGRLFGDIVVKGLIDLVQGREGDDTAYLTKIRNFINDFRIELVGPDDSPVVSLLTTLASATISMVTGVDPISIANDIKNVIDKKKPLKKLREILGIGKDTKKRRRFILVLDDIKAFSSEHSNFFNGVLEALATEYDGVSIHVLGVVTITEGTLAKKAVKEANMESEIIVKEVIADLMERQSDDMRVVIARNYSPGQIIPPVSPKEFADIVKRNLRISEDIERCDLARVLAYSGWHVAVALTMLKYAHRQWIDKGMRGSFCSFMKYYLRGRRLVREGVSGSVTRVGDLLQLTAQRFISVTQLLSEMWKKSIVFLGITLQPSGISSKELSHLCRNAVKLVTSGIDRKRKLKYLPEEVSGMKCDEETIRFQIGVYENEWEETISVYEEKWPEHGHVIAVKPGSYLHHIPMLLQELEQLITSSRRSPISGGGDNVVSYISRKMCPGIKNPKRCGTVKEMYDLVRTSSIYRLLLVKTVHELMVGRG